MLEEEAIDDEMKSKINLNYTGTSSFSDPSTKKTVSESKASLIEKLKPLSLTASKPPEQVDDSFYPQEIQQIVKDKKD